MASRLPVVSDFTLQQVLNRDAIIALLTKIGPAILLTHSQAGAFGWPVADARPDLVKAIVAVEPSGPPFYDVQDVGAPEWFPLRHNACTAVGRHRRSPRLFSASSKRF
jgi:pimeloyl-ACP methyl ester carboxylesterase